MSYQHIADYCEHEHAKIESLFQDYLDHKGSNLMETQTFFRRFKCSMHRHMDVEEEVLFKVFYEKADSVSDLPTILMRKEHQEMREVLNKISVKLSKGDLNTTKEEAYLRRIFHHHGENEDRFLFDPLEQSLTREEKEKLFLDLEAFTKGHCPSCATA